MLHRRFIKTLLHTFVNVLRYNVIFKTGGSTNTLMIYLLVSIGVLPTINKYIQLVVRLKLTVQFETINDKVKIVLRLFMSKNSYANWNHDLTISFGNPSSDVSDLSSIVLDKSRLFK